MINKSIMICCNNVISLIIFYVPFPIAINEHYVTTFLVQIRLDCLNEY